jgi:CBS domain containing-hemolysin-like protein
MDGLIYAIIFLLLSAFFSGVETAFTLSNKLKIEVDKSRNLFSARLLSVITRKSSLFFGTVWLGNIISLVAFAIFTHIYISEAGIKQSFFSNISYSLFTLFEMLALILIYVAFGEIAPKTLFRINPNNTLKFLSFPIYVFYIILFPAVFLLNTISEFILRNVFRAKDLKKETNESNYELDNLLKESNIESTEGKDESQELQMFRNARDLNTIKVRDFMVQRNEIVAIEKDEEVENLGKLIVESGHSKILVYDDNIDNIIGYTHSYDMFARPGKISEIIKPVIIVPGTMTADKLLNKFILERKSVALVVDEFGGTDGMLTIEDILEEIFGDIDDEYDVEEAEDKQINENEILVSGRLDIEYLNEKYNLEIQESDEYNTIAGYILHYFENIPSINEEITINNLTFIILKASESKIEQILIRKL